MFFCNGGEMFGKKGFPTFGFRKKPIRQSSFHSELDQTHHVHHTGAQVTSDLLHKFGVAYKPGDRVIVQDDRSVIIGKTRYAAGSVIAEEIIRLANETVSPVDVVSDSLESIVSSDAEKETRSVRQHLFSRIKDCFIG